MSEPTPAPTIDEALAAFRSRLPAGSELVTRAELAAALGERPQTLANRDCCGTGPGPVVRIGARVFYTVESVLAWVRRRLAIEVAR